MSEVALTVIALGHDVDGNFERVYVSPGEVLPAWVSNEEKKVLRENGALGAPPKVEAAVLDAKDAEIAELKAKLAEATKAK